MPSQTHHKFVTSIMPVQPGLLQRQCACGNHTIAGGECAECHKKRLQRKGTNHAIPDINHEVFQSPGGSPDSIPHVIAEPRFGYDFGKVRVHAPTSAAQLTVVDSPEYELEADRAADAVLFRKPMPALKQLNTRALFRQKLGPDEPLLIDRNFELDPHLFLKPMNAPAPKEVEKCEEFPGGSTDCEVNEETGIPTGKVRHRVDETNPCTKPCVEQHEAVHVKQMKTLCPQLRDCYIAADKGKRSPLDCIKMTLFGSDKRECEAYKVSVPCVERRLKYAKECQTKSNKEYGKRKLESERCFHNKYCGGAK